MRFYLRTLLILAAAGPPILAAWWWAGVEWSKIPFGMASFTIISIGLLFSAWRMICEPW